jgi:lysozyme
MIFSNKAIEIIKQFEGFRSMVYDDGFGIFTIGYGTVLNKKEMITIHNKLSITEAHATDLLIDTLQFKVIPYLKKTFPVNLKQCKIDALCSLCYNCGKLGPNLIKAILNNNELLIKTIWLEYCHVNKSIVPGLLKRRKSELNLFFS